MLTEVLPAAVREEGIRCGCCLRTSSVRSTGPEQQYWMIQPLLDAGMELDQIRDLVFRLAFDETVTRGCSPARVRELVRGQPAEIQAAWDQAIGRMIAAHPPDE